MRQFVVYMTCDGASAHGGPLSYATIVAYRDEVQRIVAHFHSLPVDGEVVRSGFCTPLIERMLKGAKRLLGATKEKARPVTLGEVRLVVASQPADSLKGASVRLVVLIAFFGAMRLGNVAPVHSGQRAEDNWQHVPNATNCVVKDEALFVALTHGKTNQYRERVHSVRLGRLAEDTLCPVRAFESLMAIRVRHRVPATVPLAQYAAAPYAPKETWTFDRVKRLVQSVAPSRQGTAFEKGHLTGHSFRRGFVKMAFEANVDPERVMFPGGWAQLATVLEYAAGAAVVVDIAAVVAASEAGATQLAPH